MSVELISVLIAVLACGEPRRSGDRVRDGLRAEREAYVDEVVHILPKGRPRSRSTYRRSLN